MNNNKVYFYCRSAYGIVGHRLWKWFLGGLGLSYSGVIRPRGAGFYCDDLSIKHIYAGDTISVVNLFLGCLLGPILFILPVEIIKKWSKLRSSPICSGLLNVWQGSWFVWRAQLIGILVVLVLTEFSKTLVSEPRPHFWDSCKPNVTEEICSQGYVNIYKCTSNFTKSQILDSQKSFPSGHTSMSMYTAIFMIWYLGRAVHWPHSFMIKPCLQLLWACFAFLCSLTRITDRRHHWWDVLAGATLGVGVAFFLTQAVSRSIRSEKESTTAGGDPTNDFNAKDDVGMHVLNSSGSNSSSTNSKIGSPSKRLSVRRLLSNSSITTTIAEDHEINDLTSP